MFDANERKKGYPVNYPALKGRDKLYDGAQSYLQSHEEKLARIIDATDPHANLGLRLPISMCDIAYLIEELYRGRSVVSGVPTKLVLIRWRRPEGSIMQDLGSGLGEQKTGSLRLSEIVSMTKDEATRHWDMVLKGGEPLEAVYDAEVIARVEARLAEARVEEKYRL